MTVARLVLFCLIPVGAAICGGLLAAWRRPGDAARSALQHFSAGLVFAAASLELLPPVRAQGPLVASIGIILGTVTMLAMRRATRLLPETGGGVMAAIALDLFIDGMVTGSGFALGEKTGVLLIVALVLEYLFLGLVVAGSLRDAPAWQIVALPSALGVLTIPAAVVGYSILGTQTPAVLGGFLGFGTVAMLYLVTEELLREAHEQADTEVATALFFLGFLLYLVISQVS